jgi:hypothetical protein
MVGRRPLPAGSVELPGSRSGGLGNVSLKGYIRGLSVKRSKAAMYRLRPMNANNFLDTDFSEPYCRRT